MKQVWMCNHCSEHSESAEKISAHEKECAFNPETKRCYSCGNRTIEGAPISGLWNGCKAGIPYDYQQDVSDGETDCSKWEPEAVKKARES